MLFFAIENKVDWIALSFVRTPNDLEDLQDLIAEHSDHKIPIIAKIEKPEAVENIDKIVAFRDGLMVARGDLGVLETSSGRSTFDSEKIDSQSKNSSYSSNCGNTNDGNDDYLF